jgi:glutamate N-acetyltransferase / amino-acid N-acetyltransferase
VTDVPGGVVAPQGFSCHAVMCGIKDPTKPRLDLAVIVSETPAVGAATFTSNKVKAAPVRVSAEHLKRSKGKIRAIVASSGNANACTGPRGLQDALAMCQGVAGALKVKPTEVLVCSTGIIGLPMPMERLTPFYGPLVADRQSETGDPVAQAIMTSDTHQKSVSVEFSLGGKTVRMGACAKGAGMICPSMGTMFCFVTTDAAIGAAELRKATLDAVEHSFNRISVDGDTSTNDTVIVMANGAAGQPKILSGTKEYKQFVGVLHLVMLRLAKMLVRDGERVTKLVEIIVKGANTHLDAKKVAEAVANSMLVKCSWNGSDPNWGRVLHAVGYSGLNRFDESLVDIYFDGVAATRNGVFAGTSLDELKKVAAKPSFSVTIDLNLGKAGYNVFTSDLSQEYVSFNAQEYAVRLENKPPTPKTAKTAPADKKAKS